MKIAKQAFRHFIDYLGKFGKLNSLHNLQTILMWFKRGTSANALRVVTRSSHMKLIIVPTKIFRYFKPNNMKIVVMF